MVINKEEPPRGWKVAQEDYKEQQEVVLSKSKLKSNPYFRAEDFRMPTQGVRLPQISALLLPYYLG